MEGLSEASETTDTNTSGVGEAIKAFDGLSLSTPIKLLLIQGAIKALGEKEKLTQEQSEKLQGVLDEYDPQKPEESMGRVMKAFEDTGVSATDFNTSLATAFATADTQTQEAVKQVLTNMTALKTGMEDGGKDSGLAMLSGTHVGMTDPTELKNIEDDATSLIDDSILTPAKKAGGINSPSKKMETIGKNLLLGLKNGMSAMTASVKLVVTTLIKNLITYVKNQKANFENLGKGLVTNIRTGINYSIKEAVKTMQELADTLKEAFTDEERIDWKQVGDDITKNIYDGMENTEYTTTKFGELATLIASDISEDFDLQDWDSIGTNIGCGIYN